MLVQIWLCCERGVFSNCKCHAIFVSLFQKTMHLGLFHSRWQIGTRLIATWWHMLWHILPPLHNLSLATKCAPLTAHFVAPCTHSRPKTTKCVAVHDTFCRPWENTKRTVRIYIQCYLTFGVWPLHYVRRSLTDLGNYTVPWNCWFLELFLISYLLFAGGYHQCSYTGYLQSKTG